MNPADDSTTSDELDLPLPLAPSHPSAAQAVLRDVSLGGSIGYARTLLDPVDLRQAVTELHSLGVHSADIHIDIGSVGPLSNLQMAVAAVKPGGSLVVANLARLGRSVAHLAHLVDQLEGQQASLQIGPTLLADMTAAQMLAQVAALELQLTDHAIKDASWTSEHSRADPRGGRPLLTPVEAMHLRHLFDAGYPRRQLGALFGVSTASVHRIAGPPVTN